MNLKSIGNSKLSILSFFFFVGIQQWRLDSDTSTPALQRKDEVDSIQSCLNAVPKMKVLIIRVFCTKRVYMHVYIALGAIQTIFAQNPSIVLVLGQGIKCLHNLKSWCKYFILNPTILLVTRIM